ncbi:hypothetical protein H3V53_28270 [Paraburkholderia bengalensis]|uniref:Uncharacterized protein n=1 Tax=Paraburkholderia bengalensis TaxID=2747562 RepID=A0ABU8IZ54_9BURK
MTTCCEINVSKKPACRCLHLLQIAIAGKRWVSQGLRYAPQMTSTASKIKGLAANRMLIGHPDRLRDTRAARSGNLYLQIRRRPLRARIGGWPRLLETVSQARKSQTPGSEPGVLRDATRMSVNQLSHT